MNENLSKNQFVDLYHRTSPEAASSIVSQGRFHNDEEWDGDEAVSWFSDTPNEEMYGPAAVHVRVPKEVTDADSPGHYAVYNRDIKPEHIRGIL